MRSSLSFCLSVLVLALPATAGAAGGDPPVGLTVVTVDVGQGTSTVIRAPDGTVHVIDAGTTGRGNGAVIPTINALSPTAFGFTFASHYDTDHVGGLDEVINFFPWQLCYDRGRVNEPTTASFRGYRTAAGSLRRTVAPGQVIALGGGASMQVIAVDGRVLGGTTIPVAGSQQEENARSIAFRLTFGDFQMWVAGDLTGGGNSTADVESAASLACGDVDVYVLDHHGSNTSTNQNLLNRLDPEVAIVSAGAGNSFGHPTITVTNRIVQAAGAAVMLGTTVGAGAVGFSVCGDIRIDTDGERYRTTAENGEFLDFYVDEVAASRAVGPGELVISEFHPNPASVADSAGEYLEVTNVGSRPVSLGGLRIQTNNSSYTLAAGLCAVPGLPICFQRDGAPTRNGGLPLGPTTAFNAMILVNSGSTLRLQRGTTLDTVTYSGSGLGGSGRSTERVDLRGSGAISNFVAAASTYGAGDRGTPGDTNVGDATALAADLFVETAPNEVVVHAAALGGSGGLISAVGLAQSATTGFPLFGATVPVDFDLLFQATLTLPGFVTTMPGGGYRCAELVVPAPNPLAGTSGFACHFLFDLGSTTVPSVSAAFPFTFQ